uniref:Uncharacterized protein n=1 Tax=Timema shepardi TaxID=629360 RepID=A0A7R9AS48_TIMSH|nr:unnamed protein product [Timema shepardi]
MSRRSLYISIQVALFICPREAESDPVPQTHSFAEKSGGIGYKTRDFWICSQDILTLDHTDFCAGSRGSILGLGTDLSDYQTLPSPLTRHLVNVVLHISMHFYSSDGVVVKKTSEDEFYGGDCFGWWCSDLLTDITVIVEEEEEEEEEEDFGVCLSSDNLTSWSQSAKRGYHVTGLGAGKEEAREEATLRVPVESCSSSTRRSKSWRSLRDLSPTRRRLAELVDPRSPRRRHLSAILNVSIPPDGDDVSDEVRPLKGETEVDGARVRGRHERLGAALLRCAACGGGGPGTTDDDRRASYQSRLAQLALSVEDEGPEIYRELDAPRNEFFTTVRQLDQRLRTLQSNNKQMRADVRDIQQSFKYEPCPIRLTLDSRETICVKPVSHLAYLLVQRTRWLHGSHRTGKVRRNALSTIRPRRAGAVQFRVIAEQTACRLAVDARRLTAELEDLRYLDDLIFMLKGQLERISLRVWPFTMGHVPPGPTTVEEYNLVV